jgi:hypothetical protein
VCSLPSFAPIRLDVAFSGLCDWLCCGVWREQPVCVGVIGEEVVMVEGNVYECFRGVSLVVCVRRIHPPLVSSLRY